jgi:hypothetical protein
MARGRRRGMIAITNAIDRTVKDAAVKVFHYDTLESLSADV